jgi:hypothetical protein
MKFQFKRFEKSTIWMFADHATAIQRENFRKWFMQLPLLDSDNGGHPYHNATYDRNPAVQHSRRSLK